MTHKQPQIQSEERPECISVARLEQLRTNYEAARQAGKWQKPLLTNEQRQIATELLAELALVDERPPVIEGES